MDSSDRVKKYRLRSATRWEMLTNPHLVGLKSSFLHCDEPVLCSLNVANLCAGIDHSVERYRIRCEPGSLHLL